MADQATGGLPRIAFVYGDGEFAAHVREAVTGRVEIAYATSIEDFDATRLADARVVAILVNVDGGDWLATLEGGLMANGVRVVFNDPDISRKLEGWERARWLRHLTAKLCGSADFDPPRPLLAPSPNVAATTGASATAPELEGELPDPETGLDEKVAGQPLSAHEMETLAADFVSVPDADAAPVAAMPAGESPVAEQAMPASPLSIESPTLHEPVEPPELALVTEPVPDTASEPGPLAGQVPATAQTESEQASGLDVATETLSAMVDARLAEPELDEDHGQDTDQTWPAVSDASEIPVSDTVEPARPAPGQSEVSEGSTAESTETPHLPVSTTVVTAGDNDADVLASLPALDDWQLIDPDADDPPASPSAEAREASGPSLSDAFDDLELVPMETAGQVEHNVDPIERWLDKTETASGADGEKP